MSAISEVFTHATNFGSAVSGGVDPRTGLFNVRIALGSLVGNRNMGPTLPLELGYSPLTRVDTGFGQGVSLGLTTYDTESRLLVLSTGGQYMVQETDTKVVLQQNKLNTVHIARDQDSYRIVHKSGSVEILTGPKNAFSLKVPTAVLTPAGHRVTLKWDFSGSQPRLQEIRDESDRLLVVSYAGTSKATLWVLPDQSEGYRVELRLRNSLIGSVHLIGPGLGEPLVWNFTHALMGEQGEWGSWITGVTMPGGMSETAYYRNDGHEFPAAADLSALPCVYRLVQAPGGGQPTTEVSYAYTDTNFLGGHSGMGWNIDKDNLYEVLTGYSYGSTEERTCGGQTTRTFRSYNHYHLQTVEITQQNHCSQHVQIDYYAVIGRPFDQQPAQFQLPRKRTVTWSDHQGSRSQVTETTFDAAGNPLSQTDADGGRTEWTYYPAGGSGSDCPPEPNGFTRLLKSVTRTPEPTDFKAPVYRTTYRYAAYTGTPDPRVSTTVLKTEELRYADDQLLKSETFAYSTAGAEFGRITQFVEREYPNGKDGQTYVATHSFTFSVAGNELIQVQSLTAHDGLAVTRSQKRSRFTGRLWSTTDSQGNSTTTTYDCLGRPLTRTENPGTRYEAKASHTYAMGRDSAPFIITSTDALGSQLRNTFDGSGQPITHERKDIDGDGTWYTVQTWRYDTQGRPSSTSTLDRTGDDGTMRLTQTFSYDDWGQQRTSAYSNGESELTETDPVRQTTTTQRLGNGTPVTGREVTTHNRRGEPIRLERFDLQGVSAGRRLLERDGWGRLRREVDELGNSTLYDYDTRGRLIHTTLPDGTKISRSYAPSSSAALITGISVNGTSYGTQVFDGLGRLTSTGSGGRSWVHHYDDDSAPLPSSVTAPDDQVSTYQYVAQLNNALSHVQTDSLVQKFTHDQVSGLLTTALEEGVTIERTYYPSGRLKTETTQGSGQAEASAAWTYSLNGLDASYRGVDGTTQRITRDGFGRISAISDPAMRVSLSYDTANRVCGWTARDEKSGHTLTTALTLDDFGREVRRTLKDDKGTSWTLTQDYLENGLLAHRTSSRGATVLRDESFTYSSRNQLIEYACQGAEPPRDEQGNKIAEQRLRYDSYGNITECTTEMPGGSDTATYLFENQADPCQLTGIHHTHASYPPTVTLRYDEAGRLVVDEAGRHLSHDSLGRLESVSAVSSYGYDPLDRLLTQRVSNTTSFLSYRRSSLATVTEDSHHTRLLHLDLACVAQHRDGPQAETRLLGTDGKKTVLVSTTDQQNEEYTYTAYGFRPVKPAGSVLGHDGERVDPVLGWSHLGNGYRAYNPTLMRFIAPDSLSPFGEGGINPYAYCLGDPVNRADPSGHLSWQAWLGIGMGVAGLALTAVTAGASIAAAGGVMAAISATSATTLVVGGLGVVADVTAIASGALEEASPQASSVLGWVSLGTGFAGLGMERVNAARRALGRLREPAALPSMPGTPLQGSAVRQPELAQGLAAAPVQELNPMGVHFTQTTIGTPRYLARWMRREGWQGDPIDVVQLPGKLASIDNRRLAAARWLNEERLWSQREPFRVRVRVHALEERLPPSMAGRFGAEVETWGDAARYRISRQDVYRKARRARNFDLVDVEPFGDVPRIKRLEPDLLMGNEESVLSGLFGGL